MKQNFRIFAVVAVLLVAIASCSKEDGVGIPEPATPQEVSYRVSVKDALRSADDILNAGDRATRSVERKVKSTELYVAKPATRSNDGVEVSFYLINYEDNAGYALVSTDKRATPVYMYADEGNITTAAFEEVPPMAIFMEEAIANYEIEVASSGIDGPIDIGIPGTGTIGDYTDFVDGILCHIDIDTLTVTKAPLCQTRWSQDYPYNYLCNQRPVGCGPVAIAQVMAYYRHPEQLSNSTLAYDWDMMLSQPYFSSIGDEGAFDTAIFLRAVGDAAGADYSNNNIDPESDPGTGVHPSVLAPTLSSFGYTTNGLTNFYSWEVESEIDSNRPVLAVGYNFDDIGHAWIIDGYTRYEYTISCYYAIEPFALYKRMNGGSDVYLSNNVGFGPDLYESYRYSTLEMFIYNRDVVTGIQPIQQ